MPVDQAPILLPECYRSVTHVRTARVILMKPGTKAEVKSEGESGGRKGAAQRIFDSACELFYKRGIRAVGVDEIVSAAGVTKASLYRSYAPKSELVTA